MNMYTALEYRRRGIAFHILDLLVKEAKELGISQITFRGNRDGTSIVRTIRIGEDTR